MRIGFQLNDRSHKSMFINAGCPSFIVKMMFASSTLCIGTAVPRFAKICSAFSAFELSFPIPADLFPAFRAGRSVGSFFNRIIADAALLRIDQGQKGVEKGVEHSAG